MLERAAQVRHREPPVDRDALHLVEDGRVRRVELVGAEHPTGGDDVERHAAVEQRAHLHGARVRAQHEVALDGVDEEGVLHRPRGMVGVEVEGVEVEPLVLELGPLRDLPAHADEDVAHLLHERGERMAGTLCPQGGNRRDIEGLGREPRLLLRDGELALARADRLGDAAASLADELAELGLLLGGHLAQSGVELGERRGLPRVGRLGRLERGSVVGAGDRGERRLDGRLDRGSGDGLGRGVRRAVRHEATV